LIGSSPKIDEDRINLHKNMVAYSGRYAVEGNKVVHIDIPGTNPGPALIRFGFSNWKATP
jgi:hypothetical protein